MPRHMSFGELFGITFAVGASFMGGAAVLGALLAVLAPGFFKLQGAPAQGAAQALLVVLLMLLFGLVANLIVSATGSAIWLGARRFIPWSKTAE
jgi:hypothetical protein